MRIAKLLPVCTLMLPVLAASSSPWGVQSIHQTNIQSSNLLPLVLSPKGDIYFAGAGQAATISKENAAGQLVFTAQIPGEVELETILLGPDGNLYVGGYATSGVFVTTPGAYEATGTGPFLCRLSGADGHVLFCTFIDVPFPGNEGFAADQVGNTYVAGVDCFGGNESGCVEKFNATGGLVYHSAMQVGYIAATAADAAGDAFVAGTGYSETSSSFLLKLDPAGQQLGLVMDRHNNFDSLTLDPDGNPQILLVGINDNTATRVRRYKADLSSIIFDTGLNNFLPLSMLLDSSGGTLLFGGTDSAGVAQVHPTGACIAQSPPEAYGSLPVDSHGVMARLDSTGQLLQSTFVPTLPPLFLHGIVQPDTATILFDDTFTGDIATATLGPVTEIQLGCLANAASFRIGPLSPEEIVSLTGSNIGPGEPVTGQPGADNRFPFELGATQVTFDGVAVPLLYVSSTQINAVTPLALTSATTHVCVVVNAATTNCMDVPVVAADPGIFMSGTHAAALNQDGTINSETNPAVPGSIVSIFATGLGAMTPPPPDGSLVSLPLPSPVLQIQASNPVVEMFVKNVVVFDPLPMYYAGPAPYEVEGLTQINIQASGSVCVAASSDTFIARTASCPPIWIAGQ
jgi:uncharacterized protein (TIGR03437 family)